MQDSRLPPMEMEVEYVGSSSSAHGGAAAFRGGEVSVDLLCECLEVAIHSVLYARELYPETIFERRRAYGVPVHMSRLPELNDYISRGVVSEVVVCFFDREEESPLERVVFDLAAGARFGGPGDRNDERWLQEVEDQFRALVLKINISGGQLPSRTGCRFVIQLRAVEAAEVLRDPNGAVARALTSGKWAVAERAASAVGSGGGNGSGGGFDIGGGGHHRCVLPLKSVEVAGVGMAVYAETLVPAEAATASQAAARASQPAAG